VFSFQQRTGNIGSKVQEENLLHATVSCLGYSHSSFVAAPGFDGVFRLFRHHRPVPAGRKMAEFIATQGEILPVSICKSLRALAKKTSHGAPLLAALNALLA
jgi:hypothetical protein